MEYNVFTEGIALGGLRDSYEIKILICYLLKSIGAPISKTQMIDVFQSQGLINYFEFTNALQELLESKHIKIVNSVEGDDFYEITSIGVQTADMLERSLPASVREKSLKAAINLLSRAKLESENKVDIVKLNTGFNVKCTILDQSGSDLMSIELFVPDELQAQLVKEQFLNNPESVYKGVIKLLIDNEKIEL